VKIGVHSPPVARNTLSINKHSSVAIKGIANTKIKPQKALSTVISQKAIPQKKKKYRLPELLQLAWAKSPRLQEARYQLAAMEARKSEAFWSAWWPQGTLLALVAPAPPARGTPTVTKTRYPEAYWDLSQYGILTRIQFSLVWPLYTFGKLSLLHKAADDNVRASKANISLEKGKWELLVKKAYYSLQFAESALVLLDEAEEYLETAKKKMKAKSDRLKLQVIEAEVQSRRIQAETGKRLAQSGLARLTGLPISPPLELEEFELEVPSFKLKTLLFYQRKSRIYRPEIQILNHTLQAKRKVLKAEKRKLLPDIYLKSYLKWGYSSASDDQLSPFARDDYNFLDARISIGLRFSLGIPIIHAKIKRAEAEFYAFKNRYNLALQHIQTQTEKRYREIAAALRLIKIYGKAKKAANQWLSRTMIAFSSGLVSSKEVSDALMASAGSRFSYIKSIYDFKIAIAQLSQAVGMDIRKF